MDFIEEIDPNLPFHINENIQLGIWFKFSVHHDPLSFAPLFGHRNNLVRAAPARRTLSGHITRPPVYDTVLVEFYPDMIGLLREYNHTMFSISKLMTFCNVCSPRLPSRSCVCDIPATKVLPQSVRGTYGIGRVV